MSSPLAIFNATEAAIAELKDSYLNLKIAGIEDKDGYEAAKKGLRILVGLRNKIDKRRLELKRQIDNGAKTILAELAPIEANLSKEVGTIDAELKRIEQEKREAERLRFVARTNKLFELGFAFNGVLYVFDIVALTPQQIQEHTDESWAVAIADIEKTVQAANERKAAEEAEAKRLKEENERLRRELEAKNAEQPARGIEVKEVQGRAPMVKIPVSFEEQAKVQDTTQPPANEPIFDPSMEYVQGFNACRHDVLAILNSGEQLTKKSLIEKIKNLNP